MSSKQLFPLGEVVATVGVTELVESQDGLHYELVRLIQRHQSGDWGDICEEDAELNNMSVEEGSRILSAYELGGEKIWIITEADRSVTTALFPSEY